MSDAPRGTSPHDRDRQSSRRKGKVEPTDAYGRKLSLGQINRKGRSKVTLAPVSILRETDGDNTAQ